MTPRPTFSILFDPAAHVAALATGAGLLLFVYPFVIALLRFYEYQLGWPTGADALFLTIDSLFFEDLYDATRRTMATPYAFSGAALVVPLATSLAVYLPMRAALNRASGSSSSGIRLRESWKPVLALPCAALVLTAAMLTPLHRDALPLWRISATTSAPSAGLILVSLKLAALSLTTIACLAIYWFWDNRRLRALPTLGMAIAAGLGLELLKFAAIMFWRPMWQERVYRPYGLFYNSVTVVLLGYLAVIILVTVRAAAQRWSDTRPDAGPAA